MTAYHKTLKCLTQLCLMLMLGTFITGCATTASQEFRDIMKDIDALCRRDHQGPYYDRTIPNHTQDARCDILSIKPADPLATEEGRFAYSIKLPAPYDKLKTEFTRWMAAESYFKQLCEKDAGEWIFKTVDGVEGVFLGRNYQPFNASNLVFQMKETNEILNRNMEVPLVQPIYGRYNYMERLRDSDETGKLYVRFFRGAENKKQYPTGYTVYSNGSFRNVPYIVNSEQSDTIKSRYAFTWRQISTSDMLENGITGGETIIYDRTSNEVLAFRRFFYRYWARSDSKSSLLTNGDGCQPGFTGGASDFIQKVLVPVNPAE
jgi:hypothetical protein